MAVNVSTVCAELEGVAAIFGAYDTIEDALKISGCKLEGGFLVYRTAIGGCKLKLVMSPDSESILLRAGLLKKRARKLAGANTESFVECRRASNWKPTLRQAKRSRPIAQEFLDDGERGNWLAYDLIYQHTENN